jgi:selenide,water dikinase
LSEIAAHSGVSVEIDVATVPLFDGVRELIAQGVISGAVERNREYSAQFVQRGPDVREEDEVVLFDPQTSGGLLMCVPSEKAGAILGALHERGIIAAAKIGRVIEKSDGRIFLK